MKKINYFPCPTHSGNALSIVCTDRFCYDNALICSKINKIYISYV